MRPWCGKGVFLGHMVNLIGQLRLSWSENPQTTMTVTWQSREPLSNPVVQYGEGKEFTHSVPAERIRYPQETGALYTATLRALTPGTEYTYRAGDASKGWSEMRTFRTAPMRAEGTRFIHSSRNSERSVPGGNSATTICERLYRTGA